MYPEGLSILIDSLQGQFPGMWVADRLPPSPEKELPAIVVSPIPGGTEHRPWGEPLPLADLPAFDIDVYGLRRVGWGALHTLAGQVRVATLILERNSPQVQRVDEDVPITRRPDWNENIIRMGGEYSLRIPRIR